MSAPGAPLISFVAYRVKRRMAAFTLGRRRLAVLLGAAALIVSVAVLWGPALIAQYDRYRGRVAMQRFQTDAGVKWLLAGESIAPDDAETHFLLARAFRRQGKYDDAARHLKRAGPSSRDVDVRRRRRRGYLRRLCERTLP